MKAVILEINRHRAVVMKEDGTVARVRNRNYSVGDEINMKEGMFSSRKWAPVVAALLIFAMVGTGTWVYATPGYEVSLTDGEGTDYLFEVNKLGKVISVRYDSEDDFEVLDDENYTGKDINEAIILIIEYLGYDEDDYDDMVITAIANDKSKSEKKAKELSEKLEEYEAEREMERERLAQDDDKDEEDEDERDLAREREREEFKEIKGLDSKEVLLAKGLGITPGKYNIVKNLMGEDDVEEYLDELRDELVDEDDDKELSKKIMEEFSRSRGEKNGVKFQEEADDKDEKDNPSQFAPRQDQEKIKESRDNDDLDDDIDDDDKDEKEEKPEKEAKPEKTNGNSKKP